MKILQNVVEFPTALIDDNNQPIVLHITQPTGFDKLALTNAARDTYPMFDEEPFRKPDKNSVIPDDTYIDKKDPDYVRMLGELAEQRNEFILNSIYNGFVDVAKPHTKEAVIEALSPVLERKAGFITMPKDAWYATLLHGLLSDAEFTEFQRVINGRMPLEEGEVVDGLRLFRPVIPAGANRGLDKTSES